jgi:hypothetical protein
MCESFGNSIAVGRARGGFRGTNRKGCGIGYALVINSCEEVGDVESCTVTAPDAITAFAVPNPNGLSRRLSVFSGLVARRVASSG